MSLEKEKKITPHMFRPKIDFSITINPEEQYEQDPERLEKIVKRVRRKMDNLSLQYILHAELSSPSSPTKHKYPRVHFHGIIRFENAKQIKRWYTMDYFKLADIGYFEIDQLNNPTIWYTYCTKEDDIMRAITTPHIIKSLRHPEHKLLNGKE